MNPLGIEAWFSAFVFTQIVEVPIYRWTTGISIPRAFVASAITHPIVWFGFFNPAVPWTYDTKVVAAECFAWLAEAAYLHWSCRVPGRKAVLMSLLANAASVLLGGVTRELFGWP